MAKRWLKSADVFIDDEGRIGVALPEELLSGGRLKVDAATEATLLAVKQGLDPLAVVELTGDGSAHPLTYWMEGSPESFPCVQVALKHDLQANGDPANSNVFKYGISGACSVPVGPSEPAEVVDVRDCAALQVDVAADETVWAVVYGYPVS